MSVHRETRLHKSKYTTHTHIESGKGIHRLTSRRIVRVQERHQPAGGEQAERIKFPDASLNAIGMRTSYMICFNLLSFRGAVSAHIASFSFKGENFTP